MMGITRRTAVAGLAGATASLALGACTRRNANAVHFWAMGREGEVTADLMQDFVRDHPDVPVVVQKLPWLAAHEKLLTAYAGEALPDLCQLGNTWIPEFEALDALEPLDPFVTSSSIVKLDDYFPGMIAANRIGPENGGRLFGLPWYADTRLLYYRRDLLKQAGFANPPNTWDEWSQMMGAIKAMVGEKRYSVLLPLNEFEPLLVLGLQQPAELLRDDGRFGNFRSDDFHRVLAFYRDIFAKGWAPRMTNTELSNVWDEFGRGYFSFYISGPWNIGEFKKRLPPELQDSWMTAPMPGPHGPGDSSAGGSSLVIFKSSERKEGAWKVAEFLSLPSTQQKFYELMGDIPPRLSSWESPALSESPYALAYRTQLGRVRSPPKVPEWERIAQEMRFTGERVAQQRVTIEEAATQLDRTTDEILEKRRWMMDREKSRKS
jgi:multiple sugar transport system substrate-binding protein